MITEYSYYDAVNETNRLKKIRTYVAANPSTEYMNQDYFYDYAGNITHITDHLDASKTRTYEYDELNRLTQASTDSTGVYGGNLVYSYDKVGNITYNCKYGYYYYDDVNHPHAVTRIEDSSGGLVYSYAYDENGNMMSGAGRSFTYDYDNRPLSISYNSSTVTSVYDASGKRVRKMVSGSVNRTTTYIGDIYECTDGQCVKYVFAGSQRIAKIDDAGNSLYYHTDHLGSSTVMTNDSAGSEQDIFYYPYGEIFDNSGTDVSRHKFTGQEWDAETGLYYYGARYYDPKLARFISADTIVPYVYDPQSLNRYSYCVNNPVIYTDPNGHGYGLELLGNAAIGAAIGAVAAGIASDWDGDAVWKGAVAGAVVGLVANWASGYVGSVVGAAVGCGAYCTTTAYYTAQIASGATTGAIAGAAGGATLSALYGGNIGQGAMYGAMGGAVFGGIGGYYGGDWGLGRVGTYGLAGGAVAEWSGGSFEQGAMYALITALSAWIYVDAVGNEPNATPGEELVFKESNEMSYQGDQNTGLAVRPGQTTIYPYNEHHPIMRFINRGPLISAFSTYHDNIPIAYHIPESAWYGGLAFGPSHVYALGITYAAYMATTTPSVYLNIYLNSR